MPITLKELSQLAGAHPSTVARVLQQDPRQRVSAALRARILELAQTHHYRPNQLARSLRTKRSAVLGALIPDIANPFFASVLRGMEDAAEARGYSLLLANTDDLPEREARGLALLRARQVDGLLLATARRQDPALAQLAAEGVPFVLVNRATEPLPANAVVPDDAAGASAAVAYLVALGHRRIAHIAGAPDTSTGYLRQQGYRATLQRHGLAVDPALLVSGSFREAGGYAAMQALLALAEPPTAVFAVNDLAALGALAALRAAGRRVPEEVSVIGFNDLFPALFPAASPLLPNPPLSLPPSSLPPSSLPPSSLPPSSLTTSLTTSLPPSLTPGLTPSLPPSLTPSLTPGLTPSLTTLAVPHRALGAQAAERLLAWLLEGVAPDAPLLLPVQLVVRASTGPAPTR